MQVSLYALDRFREERDEIEEKLEGPLTTLERRNLLIYLEWTNEYIAKIESRLAALDYGDL